MLATDRDGTDAPHGTLRRINHKEVVQVKRFLPRIVCGLIALALVAGIATRAPAIQVSTYFIKGYNNQSDPSATVTDSIGNADGASETFTSGWIPCFGAKAVHFHVMASNAATDSSVSVFFAVHDTSAGGVELSPSGGSVNADRQVVVIGTTGTAAFNGATARVISLYANHGTTTAVTHALGIPQAWCRIRVRSRANDENTAAAVLRDIKIRAHAIYDGEINTRGVYAP